MKKDIQIRDLPTSTKHLKLWKQIGLTKDMRDKEIKILTAKIQRCLHFLDEIIKRQEIFSNVESLLKFSNSLIHKFS